MLNRAVSLVGGRSRSGGAGVTEGGDDAIRALDQAYRVPLLVFVVRLTGGDRQFAEDGLPVRASIVSRGPQSSIVSDRSFFKIGGFSP